MPERSPKFSAIVSFFEMLATQHVSLQHSATQKHFFRLELDEVLTALPEQMCYPALVLESYNYSLQDMKSDNPSKNRGGGFMLVEQVPDPGDYDLIHQKWDALEEITDDIIARIKAEKKTPFSPVRDFDLNSVSMTLYSSGTTIAMRIEYAVVSRFIADVDPAKWIIP
jgi:hypothetical protein